MSASLALGQYYGEVLAGARRSGLVLTELRHPEARALPEHTHATAFLCLLLRGAYAERVGRRRLEYRPFTVGYHPAGLAHSDEVGREGGVFFSVELPEAWLRAAEAAGEAAPPDRPELHGGRMSALATRLHRAWRDGDADDMTIDELALELVAEAARAALPRERARPRWLGQCFDLLHAEFFRPLTVAEVATRVAVHPVHLSREFRRRYGQTMGEYLNHVRVRRACEQLERSDVVLGELAAGAGFADQSHLCRVFKRLIGCSPGDFRRFHRSKTAAPSPA